LWAVAHLTFFIFFAGMEVGLIQICLALHDGKEVSFTDTIANLALGPKFFVGQLIYLAMVLVGLVLIVVPGVYLGVRYSLFGFYLVTRDANLIPSFQQSAVLSKGAGTYLLIFFIFLVLLNVLGAGLLGLGLLITVPLSVLMMASVYRQLGGR